LCTSIKFAFKITTVAVELKSYSEIKDTNNIKSWVCDLGRWWGGGYDVKLGIFLFGSTGVLWCHSVTVCVDFLRKTVFLKKSVHTSTHTIALYLQQEII
jgi:hypothetical protein